MFGFGKKKVSEENVTWSPPTETLPPLDELELCRRCRFSGKCQFSSGCKVFRQTVDARAAEVEKVRGFKRNEPGKIHLNYIYGLSWKDKLDNFHFGHVKVSHVDGDVATMWLCIVDGNKRSNRDKRSSEFTIRIPMTRLASGKEVVDFVRFRSECRKKINELM